MSKALEIISEAFSFHVDAVAGSTPISAFRIIGYTVCGIDQPVPGIRA
jgi:hypothetical protein